ncbi:MAG: ABC transporter permease [Hyphomicrobiaceae bacterium]
MTAADLRETGSRSRLSASPPRRKEPLIPKDWVTGYGLMLPVLIICGVALAFAMASTVLTSFWTQEGVRIIPGFTLRNYAEAVTNPLYQLTMMRSLVISISTTALTILLAYPIAYFLAFYAGSRRTLWLILITTPFWTSYLLRVFSWKVILGYNGVINSGLKIVGLISEPLDFLVYNPIAVILTLVHAWLPFAILPLFVSLEKIDRSYLEAATDLGDSPRDRLWRIVFPLSVPGVMAASLMIFIPTVGDYVTPQLVGGPDGQMVASSIVELFGRVNDKPLGSALAIVSILIVTAISLTYMFFTRRISERIG